MDRRAVVGWMTGFAASSLLAPLSPDHRLRIATTLPRSGEAAAFTPAQAAIVATLADAILPRTDTPGALDVRVPAFIDRLTAEWYSPEEADRLRRGLLAIEARATTRFGRGVAALAEPDRTAFLGELDGKSGEPGSAEDAFDRIKALTVYGYFTSQLVQTEILDNPIIPGRFEGCIPERPR